MRISDWSSDVCASDLRARQLWLRRVDAQQIVRAQIGFPEIVVRRHAQHGGVGQLQAMRLAQSPAVFDPVGAARLKPHLELAIDTAPVEMQARNVLAVGADLVKGGEAVAGMRPERARGIVVIFRSEEHTSELQSL